MKTSRFFLLQETGFLFWVVVCAVAGLAAVSSAAGQQQTLPDAGGQTGQDEVLRVDTTLVTLPVSVVDRHGKFMMGLRQEQFHIYEDGVEQGIAYFEAPGSAGDAGSDSAQRPFTVALLLDVSDSTQFKLEEIRRAALAFVDMLRPEDSVLIVAFDKRVQVLAEATNNRDTLRQAIRRTLPGGGTSLYGALDTIINQRLRQVVGRTAVVLLTDGVDTASKGASAESTLRSAQESAAAIYPVQYNTYGDFADNASRETYVAGSFGVTGHVSQNGESASEAYKRANLYLRLLADKTGGYFQYADSTKTLARSFERIAAQLRQQYTLAYYPKNRAVDGTQRQIRVEVGLADVATHTRKSYIYKPASRPRQKQ